MNNQKKKKCKVKFKKVNIFIALDILFLLGCCLFFGGRLIYFYKIEHPKVKANEPLKNVVLLEKNITTMGSGLYETSDGYIYKGLVESNYVKYSGRIWRIVSIDSDENIKLITDEVATSLVFSIDTDYSQSYARSWLNDTDNDIKSFYESLNNTDILVSNKTCTDVITEKDITCNDYVTDNVGLLSALEYNEAGGKESYLNISEYWWTSNVYVDKTGWYVYSKGTLNNTAYSGNTYYSYGIRPVITVKGTSEVKSGNGSKENPYNLDETTSNIINQKYVGDYISYNGYNWRIIETDTDYVKVVMDGYVQENGEDYYTNFGDSNYYTSDSDVGSYLNNTFYKSLKDTSYILEHSFYTGRYDNTYNYDFNKIAEYNETMKVGLLQLGELFVTTKEKYFLSTRTKTTDNNIYEVLESGRIYAGDLSDELRLRPTIYLDPNTPLSSGTGTSSDPYLIG